MSTDLFTLTEDHRAVREAIRDLAEHEIAPHAADDPARRNPVLQRR